MPPHKSRTDFLFETTYTPRDPHQNRRGTLRFPPELEMRPFSIAPNPVESQELPPNSTVFLTSHRHHEKLPEVTITSQGNTGFPAPNEKTSRLPLQCLLRPDSPTLTLEQCRTPARNSNGEWTALGPQEKLPLSPVVTRE